MSDKKYIHTCRTCGGTEVARLCWVNANTEELQPNSPVGSDAEYCFTCNDETRILSVEEVPDHVIGYFDPRPEMGLFVLCDECIKVVLYHGMNDPVKIYLSNVTPYKQTCHNCDQTIVEAKGEGWCELFSKPVPPASPVYLEQEPHIFDEDPPTTAESDPPLPPSYPYHGQDNVQPFAPNVSLDEEDDDIYGTLLTTKKDFTGQYIICDAGVFKGQPRYAPYYHSQVQNGLAEHSIKRRDGSTSHYCRVTPEDVKQYPELDDWYYVVVWDESGSYCAARTTYASMDSDRDNNDNEIR